MKFGCQKYLGTLNSHIIRCHLNFLVYYNLSLDTIETFQDLEEALQDYYLLDSLI
jgi:hypothetical protein